MGYARDAHSLKTASATGSDSLGDRHAQPIGGSRTLAAALVGALAFAATLLIQRDFVLNAYLHADDAIFIPRALAGQASIPRSHPLIYLALEALGPIASISTLKLLSTGFLGLAAALMALWLLRMGAGALAAGLAAVALVTHPVAIDQGLFVTGSHPIIGTVLILGSILLIIDGWSRSPMVATGTAGAAAAFALLAALASPCYFLAPLAPLVWLAAAAASEWRGWRRLVVLSAILSTPIILHVLRDGMQYHYTALTGWTDFSAENVAANLARAVWLVLRPVFAPPLALAATYALGLAGVSACLGLAVWNTSRQGAPADAIRPSRRLILGSAAMLVTAALAFGPSAIVTSYAPRYATAPFLLGALAVLAPPLWAVSRLPLSARLTSASLVIVLVAAGIRSAQLRDRALGPELAAHRAAMGVIATEAASWEPNAQIVLVLPADSRSPTEGFKITGAHGTYARSRVALTSSRFSAARPTSTPHRSSRPIAITARCSGGSPTADPNAFRCAVLKPDALSTTTGSVHGTPNPTRRAHCPFCSSASAPNSSRQASGRYALQTSPTPPPAASMRAPGRFGRSTEMRKTQRAQSLTSSRNGRRALENLILHLLKCRYQPCSAATSWRQSIRNGRVVRDSKERLDCGRSSTLTFVASAL